MVRNTVDEINNTLKTYSNDLFEISNDIFLVLSMSCATSWMGMYYKKDW